MRKIPIKTYAWFNRNLIGFSLASLFNDISYEMLVAILPAFLTQLAGTSAPWFASMMGGISEAAASLTKLISGMISDTMNIRKPFIASGYALGALFNGIVAAASSAWYVIIFQAISRIGKGLRGPARDALLSLSIKPAYYGRAFGFTRAMDTCGAILGPLIALIALPHISVRFLIACSIIPGVLAVGCIMVFIQEQPIAQQPSFSFDAIKQFKQLPYSFIFFLLMWFIFNCGNFHVTLLILRAQEVINIKAGILTAQGASIFLYIVFNLMQAISEYALGRISDRGGRQYLLACVGFLLFSIVCLLLAFVPSLVGIISAFMLAGISIAATSALSRSYAADLLPHNIRGLGYGILQATEGTAKLIAGFMVGTLWTTISPAAGFSYAATTSIIAALAFLVYKQPSSKI